jgi:hypothetical protein
MTVPHGVLKLGRKLKERAEREHRHAKAPKQPPAEPSAVAISVAPPAKKIAPRIQIDRLKEDRELAALTYDLGNTPIDEQAVESVLTGATTASEPVLTGDTSASELVSAPLLVMRLLLLRKAPRVPLVKLCMDLVKQHGPLTIDEMIAEIWGSAAVGTDDARWLKAQLCKWLTAAAKESGEQFYPKRHRNPARPNTRLHRWGFWAEQQPPDRRYVAHNAEVLAAIAELRRTLDDVLVIPAPPSGVDNLAVLKAINELRSDVASVQATVNVLSRWLSGLKDGVAYLHEKLTWSE